MGGLLAVGCGAYLLLLWPLRDPHPAERPALGAIAVRNARIYRSAAEEPVERGTLLARDGLVAEVGPDVAIPPDAQLLPCDHCAVVAGYWNAHVHFTEGKWDLAAWKGKGTLDAQLADMLGSRGFTTVVDAGSDPRVTISLRRRIESGELLGPAIYTAASALYPPAGIPYYLKDALPPWVIWLLPQPASPAEAAKVAERNLALGADLLKLFTGSYVARGEVRAMPLAIARAAVEVAHRDHRLVYAHASNLAGTEVAIRSGVDVLAHAPDSPEGIGRDLLRDMVDGHMAMIPTLKMFATTVTAKPSYLEPIHALVREFRALGGQLLFGTDVGYMTDYRTEEELRALTDCGLGARDILRMLTSAPAERFGVGDRKGTLAAGRQADFVVLDGDPLADPMAFARVRATVRGGRVLYLRQP